MATLYEVAMARVFAARSERLRFDLDRHRVDITQSSLGFFAFKSFYGLLIVSLMALKIFLGSEDANPTLLITTCVFFLGVLSWQVLGRPQKWLDLRHRVLHWTERKYWRRRQRRVYCGTPVEILLQRSTRWLDDAVGGETEATVFQVSLRSQEHSHELANLIDEVAARRAAESLARYFEIPLRDLRNGEVFLSVRQLARPLSERTLLHGLEAQKPGSSEIEVAFDPGGLRILLRGGLKRKLRFWLGWGLALVVCLAFWRYGWYGRVENGLGPTYWRVLAL